MERGEGLEVRCGRGGKMARVLREESEGRGAGRKARVLGWKACGAGRPSMLVCRVGNRG